MDQQGNLPFNTSRERSERDQAWLIVFGTGSGLAIWLIELFHLMELMRRLNPNFDFTARWENR